MRQLATIVLVFLLIHSCTQQHLDIYDEQRDLNRISGYFPDSLWTGFPNIVNENTRVIQAYNPAVLKHNLNYYGIFILEYSNEIRDFISENDYSQNILGLVNIDNSLGKEDFAEFSIKGSNKDHPISQATKVYPNFREQYSPVIKHLDPLSWNLVYVETSIGETFENEYIEYSKSANIHGVSKGMFVNSSMDSVIYWLMAW